MNRLEPIGTRTVPRNYGPLREFDAHARIEGTDTMEFWLAVRNGAIERASFTTDGGEISVACGAMAAHLSCGKAPEAIHGLRPSDVLAALGLTAREEARTCADLALRTLGQALASFERQEACAEDCAGHNPAKGLTEAPGAGGIRKRILVLSGKGGVGKSTVAVNLAMGFAFNGLRTGLLDVDLHGPSVPKLLGLERERLRTEGRSLLPVPMGGLKVLSLGFALEPDEAAVWRGPRKAGVVEQFVKQAQWGELDALVVDCPPGTGDEHLSILQALGRVDGAVIVTTPQDLAVLDARKAVTFCRTAGIPILGVVENMSGFTCPSCGTATPVFRTEGGERMARELKLRFLGALPIDPEVGEAGDAGQPRLYRELGFGARKAFRGVLQRLLEVVEVPVP
jgi:Mrp family chromosome partitioning ATPase